MRSFYLMLSILVMSGFAGIQAQADIVGIPGTAPLRDQVNISQLPEDLMPTMRNVTKIHAPVTNADKTAFQLEKERANTAFLDMVQNDPVDHSTRGDAPNPLVLNTFEANPFNSGWPNDNDMAVSPSGFIVSTTNTLFRVYDPNGRLLRTSTLDALGGSADNIPGNDFNFKVSNK